LRPRDSVLVTAMVAMALVCALGAQSRDAAPNRVNMTGTATISGRVIVDDASAKPLRRVTVTITDVTGALPARVAVTNDAGQFAVRSLPAGRYNVTASRAPYLTTPYGATRVTRPGMVPAGTPIAVAEGQNVASVTIKMARGAVVTGVVRDVTGQPGPGFSVAVSYFQRSVVTGERTLVQYVGGGASTDDRGVYRLFGLPPGEYVVSATAYARMTDVVPTTDADVQHALDLIQRPASSSNPVPAVPGPRKPTVGYVPVYFPGTTALSNATPITIEAGQERSGVDFQIQLIATARIEGTVYGPDRSPAAGVSVRVAGRGQVAGPMDFMLIVSSMSDAKGHYALNGVAPGAYSVLAQVASGGPVPPGATAVQLLWASSDVSVLGEDLAVDLNLEPALTVTGRLALEGTAPPPDFSRIRVLPSRFSGAPGLGTPTVFAAADGTFTIPAVFPGGYRLSASVPAVPGATASWMVKSSTIGGQDALDSIAEIRSGQGAIEAVVTLTDRTTEISGTMSDASGRPAPEYFIIVFPSDRTLWVTMSRRILQTRPAQDGKYTFRNLPPGDYLIAAVTDVEQGQWFDPAFLAQLVDAGAKVTLADNEKKVQDIRIR